MSTQLLEQTFVDDTVQVADGARDEIVTRDRFGGIQTAPADAQVVGIFIFESPRHRPDDQVR